MTFTVLLTCVGDELAPTVIERMKSSDRHDIRVVGTDFSATAAGRHFCDLFEVVPGGNEPDFADAMIDLARREKVDLVIPKADEEVLALAPHRTRFEEAGCQLACGEPEILAVLSDKAACYRKLEELGIFVPDWGLAETTDDLARLVDEFAAKHREFVVKPTAMRGGRGISVITPDLSGAHPYEGGREVHMDIDTFRRDYLATYADMLPAMIMPRLIDPVHDVDMLAWQGEPVHVVPRRRADSALPNEGHVFIDAPELVDLGERLIRGFGLTWLYDCDVMYDAEGRPVVLEVNPRPSGSTAATIYAGINLFDDVISLARGETVARRMVPAGRTVVPYKTFLVKDD